VPARLIVGCGYIGLQVAKLWIESGDVIYATSRSHERCQSLQALGIRPICWNWYTDPAALLSVIDCELDTILVAVSHAAVEGVDPRETHTLGLDRLGAVSQLNGADWIYLSTTGVFAETQSGEVLDESAVVSPKRPGSIAAWAGEQWMNENRPTQSVVLRPAGIYGPERVPNWRAVRDSVPLQMDPASYLNLIHGLDLARAIEYVSNHEMSYRLYCLSDNRPVTRSEYYQFIAKLGHWPQPIFQAQPIFQKSTEGPHVSRRSAANKRICADRFWNEARLPLEYPSYVEGLTSLLRNAS
jgi:nucleoside-diphosphate-sugar epimerase